MKYTPISQYNLKQVLSNGSSNLHNFNLVFSVRPDYFRPQLSC